jgi:ribose transport system permease protein
MMPSAFAKTAAPHAGPAAARERKRASQSNYIPVLVLLVLCVAAALISGRFLTGVNLTNVMMQASIFTVLAVGMTFVIVNGGFDLSVGSIAALSGCVSAMVIFHMDLGPGAGLVAAVAVGCLTGVVNGWIVGMLKVSPLIVTLGTMVLVRGVALLITDGAPVQPEDEITGVLALIGSGQIGGVPVLPCIVALIVALGYWVIHHSTLGFRIFAVGGNEQAAAIVGIRVARVKVYAFTICGALAGLAGFLLMTRLQSGQPAAGEFYELTAIAAVVLGGASLRGGEGRLLNSVAGVFIMVLLNNILNLAGVGTYWQRLAVGIVIVAAAAADQLRRKR